MGRKEELQKELDKIEREEVAETQKKQQEKNFQMFQERFEDWVIGKAHASFGRSRTVFGETISVHGNVGHSYNAKARITSSTYTFFHNVWTSDEARAFQEKLDAVAYEEIQRIMSTLRNKLELLGLQATGHYLSQFPEDKKAIAVQEVWDETCILLDSFKDEDFLDLIKVERGWIDTETDEEVPPYKDVRLSHSRSILFNYINEKRQHLIEQFKECATWDRIINKTEGQD